ncbi:MAG: Zn-dependent exopeptidase M28 [Clostridia bacterium]|nr:Zn-dependent exopeptidase M28 [Clostridia bacterium]
MKKYILILALMLIFLVGCDHEQTAFVNNSAIKQKEEIALNVNETVDETNENINEAKGTGEASDEIINVIDEGVDEPMSLFGSLDPDLIETSRAMSVIRELSSEKYEGRQAGLKPNEMAEDYIADIFERIGLETPEELDHYKQLYNQMAAYPVKPTEISIVGKDVSYQYQIDFTERFVIGRTYFDVNVVTDMILIEKASQFEDDAAVLEGKVLLISQDVLTTGIWDPLDKLQAKGIHIAAIVIGIEAPDAGMRVARGVSSYDDTEFESEDPVLITCSETMFDELTTYAAEGNQISLQMDYEYESVEVANIVGIIPGKNEIGFDETLIIGAHLDHVGSNLNGTYNAGALDNASGVSVMIELAEIIAASDQPEDTIIFVAFNGEEDGLIGSKYFVENQPVDFKSNHTKMLNLDMVGSFNEVPLKICALDYNGDKLVSSISELAEEMHIDYKKDDFGGSDHTNFTEAGIPAVMLIHLDYDYYHTYMDTVDNAIREDRLEDVIRLSLAFLSQEIYE